MLLLLRLAGAWLASGVKLQDDNLYIKASSCATGDLDGLHIAHQNIYSQRYIISSYVHNWPAKFTYRAAGPQYYELEFYKATGNGGEYPGCLRAYERYTRGEYDSSSFDIRTSNGVSGYPCDQSDHGLWEVMCESPLNSSVVKLRNKALAMCIQSPTTRGNSMLLDMAPCDSARTDFALSNCDSTSTRTSCAQAAWPSPGVIGDPHLTNLHGEKFDIHDGTHRLVHYPRGAPESEALLVVDARAVDVGSKSDCYSVYLDSVKMFGKWVGEEISISAHKTPSASNTSVVVSFAQKQTDWLAFASTPHTKLPLNGTMPITATTSMRKPSGEDAMGGEEITFEVGVQRPVLVQVWSSHGKNTLTNNEEVRYLNVQVKNLPKNSGGIIGLDGYSRPVTSRCELVQEERDLMDFIQDETAKVSLLSTARARLHWTASATVAED